MTKESDRPPPCGQRPAMRSRVDSLRQAADDREADAGQMLGKFEGIALAALGRIAAADNSNCRQVQNVGIAVYI